MKLKPQLADRKPISVGVKLSKAGRIPGWKVNLNSSGVFSASPEEKVNYCGKHPNSEDSMLNPRQKTIQPTWNTYEKSQLLLVAVGRDLILRTRERRTAQLGFCVKKREIRTISLFLPRPPVRPSIHRLSRHLASP